MRTNKNKDMTPFDSSIKPIRQNIFLLPVMWAGSRALLMNRNLKINKIGMEKIKPPYLVLSEHQGFTDYYLVPLVLFPHRATYVSDIEGFAAYGKRLYAQIGCIPVRRYTNDISLVKTMKRVVKDNKDIVVLFPEARHSFVGTNSKFPASVGSLVKVLDVPVVTLKIHGSYLSAPAWDETHTRKVPLSATLELALTTDEIKEKSADEILKFLDDKFYYDEYKRQFENKIKISYPKRAEGLHTVLYLCPNCKNESSMQSKGADLMCTACGKVWNMDEYGRLNASDKNTEFPHIPDWFEFERAETIKQIKSDSYELNEKVSIRALPNEKGFAEMGDGMVTQDKNGFMLKFNESSETIFFSVKKMFSVHIEFDYKGTGDCIVLSTKNCCYYLYFYNEKDVNVTKIQFAAEYFHSELKQR